MVIWRRVKNGPRSIKQFFDTYGSLSADVQNYKINTIFAIIQARQIHGQQEKKFKTSQEIRGMITR